MLQGPRSLFKSVGGGQDSKGAMPRWQAGFYPVFFYPSKKWGGGTPGSAVPVLNNFEEGNHFG
jgi:hypothetical protein